MANFRVFERQYDDEGNFIGTVLSEEYTVDDETGIVVTEAIQPTFWGKIKSLLGMRKF